MDRCGAGAIFCVPLQHLHTSKNAIVKLIRTQLFNEPQKSNLTGNDTLSEAKAYKCSHRKTILFDVE